MKSQSSYLDGSTERRYSRFDRRKGQERNSQIAGWDCQKNVLRYKKWATPSGYLCGTYAAAVLLAYYQDYRKGGCFQMRFARKYG